MKQETVPSAWTTSEDIRSQVERLWQRGVILAAVFDDADESVFPLRLKLRSPSSSEISDSFDEVRSWVSDINEVGRCRIITREFRHRIFGQNKIPSEVWVDTIDDAVNIIGRDEELRQFVEIVDLTKERQPSLLPWIARKPLRALSLHSVWLRLLNVIDWMSLNPQPNIYLRQVDLPGIDTKFLEQQSAILSELVGVALPDACVDPEAGSFAERYGFVQPPSFVRFRILDRSMALLPGTHIQDMSLDFDSFAALRLRVKNVFVTENAINYLAFTELPDSMVIFGGGYGLTAICKTPWLQDCSIYYWGDIDTHGFTILSRAREHLPGINAILMDETTLHQFEEFCVPEPIPARHETLPGLNTGERELYQKLANRSYGYHVRLEQERIPWGYAWATIVARAAVDVNGAY